MTAVTDARKRRKRACDGINNGESEIGTARARRVTSRSRGLSPKAKKKAALARKAAETAKRRWAAIIVLCSKHRSNYAVLISSLKPGWA
jgi:hypothetical protein